MRVVRSKEAETLIPTEALGGAVDKVLAQIPDITDRFLKSNTRLRDFFYRGPMFFTPPELYFLVEKLIVADVREKVRLKLLEIFAAQGLTQLDALAADDLLPQFPVIVEKHLIAFSELPEEKRGQIFGVIRNLSLQAFGGSLPNVSIFTVDQDLDS